MMESSFIKVDIAMPSIAIITMSRPEKRNALSIQLMKEFIAAINHLKNSCQVMIITSEGPVFSAGLDLKEAADPSLIDETSQTIADLYRAIYCSSFVTICAIPGDILAGGVGIAMASDYVIMSEQAHVFFPEVQKGIVPALVAVMLKRQISVKYVRELLIFGQKIDAHRAFTMGLINEVVDQKSVLNKALEKAKSVLGHSDVIRDLKKLFVDLEPVSFDDEIRLALLAHRDSRRRGGLKENS